MRAGESFIALTVSTDSPIPWNRGDPRIVYRYQNGIIGSSDVLLKSPLKEWEDMRRTGSARLGVFLWMMVLILMPAAQVAAQSNGDQSDIQRIQRLLEQERWDDALERCERALRADPDNFRVLNMKGVALIKSGALEAAAEPLQRAATSPRVRRVALYNLACVHARSGRIDEAFATLDRALMSGFDQLDHMRADPELDSLHSDPRWAALPDAFEFQSLTLTGGGEIDYVLVLPEGFDATRTYPMLIGMPPGNGGPGPTRGALQWWWGHQAARAGWIVALLMRPPNWTDSRGERQLAEVLDHFDERFNLEGGKFHVAGCSGGGPSAIHAAIAFPERFHSMTALPGNPTRADERRFDRLKDLKVRLHVGEFDDPWRRPMQRMHERLTELGVDVEFTIHSDETHQIQALRGEVFIRLMDQLRPTQSRSSGS